MSPSPHRSTTYEDEDEAEAEAILIDELGITIKNSMYPGHRRRITYHAIRSFGVVRLGPLSGRHRLVGFGVRRPRLFFHWDRRRSTKRHAIELDTGQMFRTAITPVHNRAALEAVRRHAVMWLKLHAARSCEPLCDEHSSSK